MFNYICALICWVVAGLPSWYDIRFITSFCLTVLYPILANISFAFPFRGLRPSPSEWLLQGVCQQQGNNINTLPTRHHAAVRCSRVGSCLSQMGPDFLFLAQVILPDPDNSATQ